MYHHHNTIFCIHLHSEAIPVIYENIEKLVVEINKFHYYFILIWQEIWKIVMLVFTLFCCTTFPGIKLILLLGSANLLLHLCFVCSGLPATEKTKQNVKEKCFIF